MLPNVPITPHGDFVLAQTAAICHWVGCRRARPRVAVYLASERRMPFNQQGIFRHDPELDAP